MFIIFGITKLITMKNYTTQNSNKKSKLILKKRIVTSGSLQSENMINPTVISFTFISQS